jgi:hypothetical protein
MSNKYLIQALRAYRQVTYGQFDQETRHIVQETQDAADALEKADARIAELEKGVTVKFREDATPGIGYYSSRTWGQLRRLIEDDDGGGFDLTAIQVDEHYGLRLTWEHKK